HRHARTFYRSFAVRHHTGQLTQRGTDHHLQRLAGRAVAQIEHTAVRVHLPQLHRFDIDASPGRHDAIPSRRHIGEAERAVVRHGGLLRTHADADLAQYQATGLRRPLLLGLAALWLLLRRLTFGLLIVEHHVARDIERRDHSQFEVV